MLQGFFFHLHVHTLWKMFLIRCFFSVFSGTFHYFSPVPYFLCFYLLSILITNLSSSPSHLLFPVFLPSLSLSLLSSLPSSFSLFHFYSSLVLKVSCFLYILFTITLFRLSLFPFYLDLSHTLFFHLSFLLLLILTVNLEVCGLLY